MIRLLITIIAFANVYVRCAETVVGPGGTTKKPFIQPVRAGVNSGEKTVDANFNGGWEFKDRNGRVERPNPEQARMRAEDNRAELRLQRQRAQGVAGAKNGFAQAIAPTNNQERASGSLYREGNDGALKGGFGQFGSQSAIMRNSETGNVKHANFTQGNNQIDTNGLNLDGNSGQEFNANGTYKGRQHRWNVEPENQNSRNGNGQIHWKQEGVSQDRDFNYKMNTNGRSDGEVELVQTNGPSSDFAPGKKVNWRCKSQKEGETLCYDENGNQVGRVTQTHQALGGVRSQSNAVVYDKNNVPIGRSKVTRIDEEKTVIEVNGGLLGAKTEQLKQFDCFDEVLRKSGGPATYRNQKIKVENLKVRYNSQTSRDGTEYFNWPDCFEMSADVTLPRGVSFRRMAYELVMHILPLGKYDCTDPGTCPSARDCYYCNNCGTAEHLEILDNTYGDECDAAPNGGRARIKRTVCPTPESSEYQMCAAFDRQLIGNDYFKYNGSVNAELRIWLRPGNDEELRAEFEKGKNGLSRGVWELGYRTWAGQQGINVLSTQRTDDYKLAQWYVETNGKETLLACQKAIIDYSLGGSDIKSSNGNIAVDWFSQLGNSQKLQLFAKEKCPAYQKAQKAQYAEYAKQQAASSSNSGGFGGLGNLFSRIPGLGGK